MHRMQITILSQLGAQFEQFVAPSDTIKCVKDAMGQRYGIPVELVRLFYSGVELTSSSTIASSNIKHGAVLMLVMSFHCINCRGRPGGCACTMCPRPSGAFCQRSPHCTHCLGKAGVCACSSSCARSLGAKCWPGHCRHCKGYVAECCCDSSCSRPGRALCIPPSRAGVHPKPVDGFASTIRDQVPLLRIFASEETLD